jgi:nitrogen-specific signal transduction histidine kinase
MLSLVQNDFMPHGFCIKWTLDLLSLYVVSDGLIFLSYTYIGFSLILFAKKHRDLAWNILLWLFSAFVLACGVTHLMGIVTFWQAYYWLDATFKSFTALISVATVFYLAPRLPMLLNIHTHAELEEINQKLKLEMEEHRKSNELLLKLSQQVTGMLYQFKQSVDGNYSVPYSSNGIKELFELNSEDVYYSFDKIIEQIHSHDIANLIDSIEKSAETMKLWQSEYRVVLPKKGLRYHFGQATPERQTDGSIIWHGFLTDITDSKDVEKFYHAQKLQSIGRLTSGIAHDFNNLLMAIMGNNDLNKLSTQDLTDKTMANIDVIQNELFDNTKQIEIACGKAKTLIDQMLIYCRREQDGIIKNPVLNVNNELYDSLEMMRRMIPSVIHFELNLSDKSIPILQLDESSFGQIIVNLSVNAADAIGNTKGIIKFHTGLTQLTSVCSCCQKSFDGKYVEVSVADNGSGIDPVVAKRIFEPFFTTKQVGDGTGLGLSVISGIVHKADGHVLLESEVGVGSTFRLLFPLVNVA